MPGSRPLSSHEVTLVTTSFFGRYAARNRALFVLGVRTGFRVSELLSLRVRDVYYRGKVRDRITVQRQHMKGARASRTVPISADTQRELLAWIQARGKRIAADSPLFATRFGNALDRHEAWRILRDVFAECGLTGRLGTHCMRKTFAHQVYERLNYNIYQTQLAIGHANVATTTRYLSSDQEEIDRAILAL